MKTTPPYQHQLHYQITQTDYSALRTRLTASAPAVRSACGIHMLCFSSCLPSWDEPQFALYYYDNDPTYLLLERWLDTSRTSTMVAEAECRALLSGETETALIKQLSLFCEALRLAARGYDPSHINRYLVDLAGCFHRFYTACRIKGEEPGLLGARLMLTDAARSVLKNGLALLGVDAPEQMQRDRT